MKIPVNTKESLLKIIKALKKTKKDFPENSLLQERIEIRLRYWIKELDILCIKEIDEYIDNILESIE